MLDNQRVKSLGVSEGAGHYKGIGHRLGAIGEGQHPGFAQEAHFGDFPALQTTGYGRGAVDLYELDLAGAAGDEFDKGDVVEYGVGVGQGDDAGDTASSGGPADAGNIVLMLLAGFAKMNFMDLELTLMKSRLESL